LQVVIHRYCFVNGQEAQSACLSSLACAGACSLLEKLASSTFQEVRGPKSFHLTWVPPTCNDRAVPATSETLTG
jgi:hypothetical protein